MLPAAGFRLDPRARPRNLRSIHRTSMTNKTLLLVSTCFAAAIVTACNTRRTPQAAELKVTPTSNDTNASIIVRRASGSLGTVERLDPSFDALLSKDAVI